MKIKLRDMTEEQYIKWQNKNCFNPTTNCEKCIFNNVSCDCNAVECWIKNKDLYSDKFLDQEVEIDGEILTDKEREYLSQVIRPFRNRIVGISKRITFEMEIKLEYIEIELLNILFNSDTECIYLPNFFEGTMYRGMTSKKNYTLEELGL